MKKHFRLTVKVLCFPIWYAREESNLRTRLRRPVLYPLSYGRMCSSYYIRRLNSGQRKPVIYRAYS
jgi:hypothetical protein